MSVFQGFYTMRNASQAEATAARSASKASQAQRRVAEMDGRLERLTLLCTAMWELLSERFEITDEDLAEKVYEVDMRDGRLDGKVGKEIKKCGNCGRTMNPRHASCLYCGAQKLSVSPFDGV